MVANVSIPLDEMQQKFIDKSILSCQQKEADVIGPIFGNTCFIAPGRTF
jgi:hypothetical protein